jgi:hypothetical protein
MDMYIYEYVTIYISTCIYIHTYIYTYIYIYNHLGLAGNSESGITYDYSQNVKTFNDNMKTFNDNVKYGYGALGMYMMMMFTWIELQHKPKTIFHM